MVLRIDRDKELQASASTSLEDVRFTPGSVLQKLENL